MIKYTDLAKMIGFLSPWFRFTSTYFITFKQTFKNLQAFMSLSTFNFIRLNLFGFKIIRR